MRYVVILRHGDAPGVHLSVKGELQIGSLAETIGKRLNQYQPVLIISSPAIRAQESAAIIAERMAVVHQTDEALGHESGVSSGQNVLQFLEDLQKSNYQSVVVVTHLTAATQAPESIAERFALATSDIPGHCYDCWGKSGVATIFDYLDSSAEVIHSR